MKKNEEDLPPLKPLDENTTDPIPLEVVLYADHKPFIYGKVVIQKGTKYPDLVQPASAAFRALCDRLKEEEVKERQV